MDLKLNRSLSEDFYSRSPGTQAIIKFYVENTPTSKYNKEYNNKDKYNESTNEEKKIMIQYGLINTNQLYKK